MYFRTTVEEFLLEYQEVFDATVTVKFHNMIDYTHVIRIIRAAVQLGDTVWG